MNNLFFAVMLALLCTMTSCTAQSEDAVAPFQYVEGRDYALLPRPVKTADPEMIEVTEIFWYGCVHCLRFQPHLEDWVPALADDVKFVRLPAIWSEVMELHAAMFYAAESLDLTEQLHRLIFERMNFDRDPLESEAAILKFVRNQGLDAETYRRALQSFGVSSQVLQAKSKMGAYAVRGTPEMVINGTYKLTSGMAGSNTRMLEIADALIARERALGGRVSAESPAR